MLADSVAEIGRRWAIAAHNVGESRFRYWREATYTIDVMQAQQPIMHVRCERSDLNSSDSIPLRFPVIDSLEAWLKNNKEFPIATNNSMYLPSGMAAQVAKPQLSWINLPQKLYGKIQ